MSDYDDSMNDFIVNSDSGSDFEASPPPAKKVRYRRMSSRQLSDGHSRVSVSLKTVKEVACCKSTCKG